jgi:hypothetical protein
MTVRAQGRILTIFLFCPINPAVPPAGDASEAFAMGRHVAWPAPGTSGAGDRRRARLRRTVSRGSPPPGHGATGRARPAWRRPRPFRDWLRPRPEPRSGTRACAPCRPGFSGAGIRARGQEPKAPGAGRVGAAIRWADPPRPLPSRDPIGRAARRVPRSPRVAPTPDPTTRADPAARSISHGCFGPRPTRVHARAARPAWPVGFAPRRFRFRPGRGAAKGRG